MSYKCNVSLLALALLLSISPVSMAGNNACQTLSTSKLVENTLPLPSQIVVVKSLGGIKANITLCQREGATWKAMFRPFFSAVIGKNGVAALGSKKEGDLKTPAGLYPLAEAFGTKSLALKMDYKYITTDDKFIDDVDHKAYNTWITGSTDAKSYETMLIEPYEYGALINYNMNPRISGAGSAIFIHIWRSPTSPTAGCIALEKEHLLIMLHWLDKAQHPYVLVY